MLPIEYYRNKLKDKNYTEEELYRSRELVEGMCGIFIDLYIE